MIIHIYECYAKFHVNHQIPRSCGKSQEEDARMQKFMTCLDMDANVYIYFIWRYSCYYRLLCYL